MILSRRGTLVAFAGAGLVAVAGCVPAPAPLAPAQPIPFRNPTVPMGGTARFDPARFAGEWHVAARFVQPGQVAAGGVQRFAYDAGSGVITGPDGGRYGIAGPGVLVPERGARLVVMWVDDGFRTAALGDEAGGYGVILDRAKRPGAVRVKAAKEILEWYGWDLSRLKETKQ